MVNDLIQHHKLIGLPYSAIIDLLGQPNFSSDSSLLYELYIDYGVEDVQYTQYLKLNLLADIVKSVQIKESEK
jgi:hypothetical protein